MPSWSSSRLLSPPAGHASNQGTSSTSSPTRAIRAPSRITEADILETALSIPTLSPTSNGARGGLNGGSSRPTRHGRSMSHPFPSLFSGKKKRNGAGSGLDSTDDDCGSPPVRFEESSTSSKQKISEKDLTTGKCMTCDSMVRWPKDLKVFRCTVCSTINDLKPILLEARRVDGHRAPAGIRPGTTPPQVPVLSIEKTKQLIDQCVTSYLLGRLKHVDGIAASPPSSPPLAPTWEPSGPESMDRFLEAESRASSEALNMASKTRPIPSSHRPIDQSNKHPGGTPSLHRDVRRMDNSPYSSSSPGTFPDTRTETLQQAEFSHRPKDAFRDPPGPKTYQPKGRDKAEGALGKPTGSLRFRPLEDYIVTSFGSLECINTSFSTVRPTVLPRAASEGIKKWIPSSLTNLGKPEKTMEEDVLSELDAKTLLLGDFAENGSWWTGGRSDVKGSERSHVGRKGTDVSSDTTDLVTVRSPHLDWGAVNEWYSLVLSAGKSWRAKLEDLISSSHADAGHFHSDLDLEDIETQLLEAQSHTQRVLLKATESLLKRPGRPMKEPQDVRFILILLANPLLYPSHEATGMKDETPARCLSQEPNTDSQQGVLRNSKVKIRAISPGSRNMRKGSSGQHSGIIKRILGLLANVPNTCHHHLVSWFARFSDSHFQRTVDLIGSFVTFRLIRQHGKQQEAKKDQRNDLVPSISGTGRGRSAALHAALGTGQSTKKSEGKPQAVTYNDDWQIKAAARVMSLFFAANNNGQIRKGEMRPQLTFPSVNVSAAREKSLMHGQILATSDFYNTLLDYSDLIADFEAWEAKRGKFSFCQYPFFLSIWAKIQIMEHDARRQMEVKAREAFFDSIMTRQMVNQYLVLKIRRDCLVEDSLKLVSEVVGSGSEEIKKGLRIEFKGEEGIDAGGLRKEWFLLLVRDVFNPEHGMFIYDEDSQFCYFNPNSFETTDQFFLVGVVLGLAIYNSTILDVALPPFAFRKLLAAGPAPPPGATSHAKPTMTYLLEDLAEFRPALASGLRQLLDFDGDVETTFCRDFVADVERYGQTSQVPLCPDGEKRAVTNSNRREFVDLYVRYLLDTAVIRQFEPFKRGFFTVCGGNALSLFRPEEIELLIRGSDEPLDIASLRAVAMYEHWGVPHPDQVSVVEWFWETFENATPKDQRKLMSFITGSDRIPAMGATNLVIKVSCLGNDCSRFPQARTCFNMISLWRYTSKDKLESMLWRAVHESEGFGLK